LGVRRYCEIWEKIRDETERSVAAQNRGRYEANTWLRGVEVAQGVAPEA
jgi:hypothetical protein